jgi:hypothetical protein
MILEIKLDNTKQLLYVPHSALSIDVFAINREGLIVKVENSLPCFGMSNRWPVTRRLFHLHGR